MRTGISHLVSKELMGNMPTRGIPTPERSLLKLKTLQRTYEEICDHKSHNTLTLNLLRNATTQVTFLALKESIEKFTNVIGGSSFRESDEGRGVQHF